MQGGDKHNNTERRSAEEEAANEHAYVCFFEHAYYE